MNDIPSAVRPRVTLIIDIVEYDDQWRVRLQRNVYSEYPEKECARREALALATDARQRGHDVEVWDRSNRKRLV